MGFEAIPFSELLSEVVDNRGRTCPTADDGIPLIATNCIRNELLYPTYEKARFVSPDTYSTWFRGHPKPGDILFVNKATPGRVCLVPDPVDFCIAQDMVAVRADRKKVYPKYLFAVLRSPIVQEQIAQMHVGTLIPHFKKGDFDKLLIPVPSPGEQQFIGDLYFDLSAKIDLNRRMNETLEAIARALFKSWFVDFDPVRAKIEGRDPGLPQPIADLFPARLVDSKLGEIPVGWEVGTLGMLGKLALGGDWGEDEAFVRAVEASCLRGVDLEHLRRDGHASPPRRWFKPASLERRAMDDRDVLVAGSGAGPTGRPLWMCAGLLQSLGPCVYSNFCKRIRCGSAAKAVYLDAWLHDMRESGEIWEHVNGTSVPNLDANSLLAGKEVPMPTLRVLDTYHDFVRPIWHRKYAGENNTLAALRDALLPNLISGELRVKDAEKFIGRIR
jgi:type I restriction enzyme S subunit